MTEGDAQRKMNSGLSGLSLFYSSFTPPAGKGKGPDGAHRADPAPVTAQFQISKNSELM